MACNGTEEDSLRYMMSASAKLERPKEVAIVGRENKHFGAVLAQGRTVFNYANLTLGEKAMSHILQSRVKIRFLKRFLARM